MTTTTERGREAEGLRECPFCGEKAERVTAESGTLYVTCSTKDCAAFVLIARPLEWNRRALPAPATGEQRVVAAAEAVIADAPTSMYDDETDDPRCCDPYIVSRGVFRELRDAIRALRSGEKP